MNDDGVRSSASPMSTSALIVLFLRPSSLSFGKGSPSEGDVDN
jgi:hypothetical protein